MAHHQDHIAALVQKLDLLLKKQQEFNIEVNEIRRDIQILRNTQADAQFADTVKKRVQEEAVVPKEILAEGVASVPDDKVATHIEEQGDILDTIHNPENATDQGRIKTKSNLEKFIGENLINKIGILITVIGVVIGAKYSIENNLISPMTRIILGYMVGLGLMGFAVKLKANYENYSAVLVSGALAILYFITYAAYDLYTLFPQGVAFGIMLLCTIFGVVAALHYNKQVIAHIGLVGAYGVPFLLSNDTGNATVLFSYMALINVGIMVISLKKYWKALYYVSFAFTWSIFAGWCALSRLEAEFYLGFGFLTVFFLLFYAIFLSYKLLKSEQFTIGDIILLFLNSFIFYGIGIALLSDYKDGDSFLGMFTLANAFIHFGITLLIYKRKLADRRLFYLTSIFVLTFITIAVPVQLDGNWVTLIWVMEAALLFWVGRSKNVAFYEHVSSVLLMLSVLSLLMDWEQAYAAYRNSETETLMPPLLNATLLTSLCCTAAFGCMTYIQRKFNTENKGVVSNTMSFALPALFITTLFLSFYLEIEYYWNHAFETTKIAIAGVDEYPYSEYNYALKDYGAVCSMLYAMLFLGALAVINIRKLKNRVLGIVTLSAGLFVVFWFLTTGLYTLSALRSSYLTQEYSAYFSVGIAALYLRYLAFACFAILLYTIHKLIGKAFMSINFKVPFELIVHTCILWITSSELLHWMDMAGSNQSYKLGLSILWGVYALILIAIGINKNKKYLRISAIALFSLTLLKLFFYDIASLNTIAKTIVFVSLGILLLIISFLYNKYKHRIADDPEN